jgi:hypothetical protein
MLRTPIWQAKNMITTKIQLQIKYAVSHKSRAIADLGYLENHGRMQREICCKLCIPNLRCWIFPPKMSIYKATFVIHQQ